MEASLFDASSFPTAKKVHTTLSVKSSFSKMFFWYLFAAISYATIFTQRTAKQKVRPKSISLKKKRPSNSLHALENTHILCIFKMTTEISGEKTSWGWVWFLVGFFWFIFFLFDFYLVRLEKNWNLAYFSKERSRPSWKLLLDLALFPLTMQCLEVFLADSIGKNELRLLWNWAVAL